MYTINKSTLGLVALSAFALPLGAQAPVAPTEAELLEAISVILKKIVPNGILPTPVVPTAHLRNDFGLDSLDFVEVLIELEERFFIEVPIEDVGEGETVATLMTMISKQTDQFADPDRIRFLSPDGAEARVGSSYRNGKCIKGLYYPTEDRLLYPTMYEHIYRLTPNNHTETALFMGANGEFTWDVFDEKGITILANTYFRPELKRVGDTLLIFTKRQDGIRVAYSLWGIPLSQTALLDLIAQEK